MFSLENSPGSEVVVHRFYFGDASPSPSSSAVPLKTPSEIRRNPFGKSGYYRLTSEQTATAWVSKNFHDPDVTFTKKEEKPGKSTLLELERGRFVHAIGVLCVCLPTSLLPPRSLPMLWSASSQGPRLQTSQGPGSPPWEISHIPPTVFQRRSWYLIA